MKINLTHWPFMRIVRMVVALACFYAYFFRNSEWFILVIGILAFLQAVSNTGCADGSCEVSEEKKSLL